MKKHNISLWRCQSLPSKKIVFRLGALVILSLLPVLCVFAQETAGPITHVVSSQATENSVPGQFAKNIKPVPVPEASEKAFRYYHSGNVLWIVNTLWGLLVPALFLFTGFSARIRNLARKMGRKWIFVIAIYVVIYMALSYVLNFPLNYYEDFIRLHEYELSNQSFNQWLGDSLKWFMVTVVMGVMVLCIAYFTLKKSPQRWWFYTTIAILPVLFLFMFVQPIWIAPMFDQFGPMQDKVLEERILRLADRAGIKGSQVFEVNKSEDTEAANGYVTGLLNTKRIVLWDTLIQKLEPDQVIVVMGHEMGHYVLGHIEMLIAFLSGLILVTLYVVHRTVGMIIHRFRDRFGFDQPSDIASLPLFILIVSLVSLAITPLALAFTRHIEHEADRFALEITRDNHAAASGFLHLHEDNLNHPRPGLIYKLWRAWHPVLAERIEFSNTYRPWETGETIKYGDRFEW